MNRSKITRVNELKKEILLSAKAEKVEMTLNTSNAIASGLLIQRLTELYENPIEATVRETVSNALDAVAEKHTGKRPEIKISAPSSINPVLVIKDNGIGMTYDDLKEIYSKYGSSTKTDNLETIGAYGLGAKSPLAYGTEFTVTSIKDNQKTTIIVAREELTNYIKIVASVETDEPSGTTVSVPVNSRDVSKFTEYIDSYKNVPMDRDVDFYINGTLIDDEKYTTITNELITYENSKETVFGRVWVDVKKAIELLNINNYTIKRQIKFIIGGWSYDTPEGRNKRYFSSSDNLIYIELKPGIVGFNSSRDAILENDRYYDLENRVIEYIKSEKFVQDLTIQINQQDLDDFKNTVSRLLHEFKRSVKIKGGKLIINQSGHSSINRKIEFSKLTHKKTGFNINDILKGVPKENLPTVVLKVGKNPHYKTSKNSIMDNELSSYDMFEEKTITSINKSIDETFTNKETSQNLSAFMVNMTSLIHQFKERLEQIKVTLVTDIDNEDQVRQLKSGRKNIVRLRNNQSNSQSFTSIIMYTGHSKASMEKMIEVIKLKGLDIKVDNADGIIEKMKEYRAANRVARTTKEKKTNVSTTIIKLTEDGVEYNANINNVDDRYTNIMIVSRNSSIDSSKMRMIHAWFCNDNNLKSKDVVMYVSRGMHTVADLNILKDKFDTNIYRDPNSNNAGISNMYYEEIHDKVAQMNAVRSEFVNTSEKAFMRLVIGVYACSPYKIMQDLREKMETLTNMSNITGIEFTSLPQENLDKFANFNTKIFGEPSYPSYSSNWRLDADVLNHLIKLLNEEHIELAQNLLTLINNRSFKIKNEDIQFEYSDSLCPPLEKVIDVYTNDIGSKSHKKLIKLTTKAYMEFAKDTLNQMLLLNL